MRVLQGYIDNNRTTAEYPAFNDMIDEEIKSNEDYVKASKGFYNELEAIREHFKKFDPDQWSDYDLENFFIGAVSEATRTVYKMAYKHGLIDGINLANNN